MTNYVPSLYINISGAIGTLTNAGQLSELRIQQRLGLPALCEIVFSSQFELIEKIVIGQSLEVAIQDADEILFKGDITAVEYVYPSATAPTLRVRGYDCLHRLRKRQHVRAYVNCGLSGLLHELAEGEAEVVRAGPVWPLLIQHQQNDLEFLTEQAALIGCYPLARGDRIYFIPLSGLPDQDDISLKYGHNLYEARIEANVDDNCTAVSVIGWDTSRSGAPHGQAKTDRTDGQSGVRVNVRDVGGMPERALINQGLGDEEHALALARAELERRQAGDVVLWGRAQGNHALQPGVPVVVGHVAPAAAGRYILTAVTHTFDFTSGYTVEFSSEPPPVPLRSRCDVATLGIVADVRDPENMGRIRARLSGYDDVETGWMPVVCPGAGKGKGLLTLPDPGDRVLVLLAREDPARGIVLGGLYAPEEAPDDCTASRHADRYTWMTRDGQRISLDQSKNMVLIENGAGAEIEMKGNEIIFKAGRIDFRRS